MPEKAIRDSKETGDSPLGNCVEWFRNTRNSLLAFARLQASGDLDAEDLLAETIKQIARALADKRVSDSPDDLTPYAFTTIRHTAITWRRRNTNRRCSEQNYGTEAEATEQIQPWMSVSEDTDYLKNRLQEKLLLLPVELAEIIIMKTWSELSFSEIARITNTAKSTVDSRYRDALARLRKMLREDPIFY